MKIETDPELPPVASKPHPLPLKHHKFVKEEVENLLEVGLIECWVNIYTTPVIVVPRKSKPRAPLAETKWLVVDYRELNKQIQKYQPPKQGQKVRHYKDWSHMFYA